MGRQKRKQKRKPGMAHVEQAAFILFLYWQGVYGQVQRGSNEGDEHRHVSLYHVAIGETLVFARFQPCRFNVAKT